jgi:hypothetical protein
MTGKRQFDNARKRTLLGIAVVMVAIVTAVALAGLGFAAGNSPTAANTPAKAQYGKPKPKKITICHHTGSKKHPLVTIVIPASAWKAHARHHDTLGRCTAAQINRANHHGKK